VEQIRRAKVPRKVPRIIAANVRLESERVAAGSGAGEARTDRRRAASVRGAWIRERSERETLHAASVQNCRAKGGVAEVPRLVLHGKCCFHERSE